MILTLLEIEQAPLPQSSAHPWFHWVLSTEHLNLMGLFAKASPSLMGFWVISHYDSLTLPTVEVTGVTNDCRGFSAREASGQP